MNRNGIRVGDSFFCDPDCRKARPDRQKIHEGLCAGPSGRVGLGTPGRNSKRAWKKNKDQGSKGSLKQYRRGLDFRF